MSGYGASPKRDFEYVAAALWGSADPFERRARDASRPSELSALDFETSGSPPARSEARLAKHSV